jgi:hypothetical protein
MNIIASMLCWNYIEQSCVYNGRNSVFNIKLLGQQKKNEIRSKNAFQDFAYFLVWKLSKIGLCFFFFTLNQIYKWLFVYTRSYCTQIRNFEDNSFAVVDSVVERLSV